MSPQFPSPSEDATSDPAEVSSSPLQSVRSLSQVPQDNMDETRDDEAATEYHSFSDSFSDSDSDSEDDDAAMTEEERKLERETRAAERQLVLEAAGIVVVAAKHDETRPPPPPPRVQQQPRFERPKRRPAPALPTSTPRPADIDKPLPIPRTIDDAYDRYEAFKQRASISSFEQLLVPPASPVSVISRESLPDRDRVRESGTSASYGNIFSQLLARSRTPVLDRETRVLPMISAPILSASSSTASGTLGTPVPEEGPAFGSVSRASRAPFTLLMGCSRGRALWTSPRWKACRIVSGAGKRCVCSFDLPSSTTDARG
jgi:hypothetical protein